MKVYIVESGEQYEGGRIEGVFASYETAVDFALELPTVFKGGWIKARAPNRWHNGCDYVEVIEKEVIE